MSSVTVTMPGGLNARMYAVASASCTVWSISSYGMPSSVQSAFSASARDSVDGSETDREPARGNVIPWNVHYHRCPTTRPFRLDRNPRVVDCDEVSLDHAVRFTSSIVNVHALAAEPFVVTPVVQRTLGARRRHLEVVRAGDELGVINQRPHDPADALAVLDRDRVVAIDLDPERACARAGLLDGVELIAHVHERGLDEGFDRRYGPGRHVRSLLPTLPAAVSARPREVAQR